MVRPPNFQVFPDFSTEWPDVLPGDVIIVPYTNFYNYDEYVGRTKKTLVITTQKKPLFVIARLDRAIDDEQLPPNFSTFIVYSVTRGFLIKVMSRGDK